MIRHKHVTEEMMSCIRCWAPCCKANHPARKAFCHIFLIGFWLRVPVKPLENRNRLCGK